MYYNDTLSRATAFRDETAKIMFHGGMDMQLRNKVAVVLGASAEGGTGWAIAEALAAAGAKVMVASRSLAPLEKLAGKIGGKAIACDAGRESDIIRLVQATVDTFGKIDIAVNAAGLPMLGMIADAQADTLQQALDVNYLGNVHFVKQAAAAMNDGGSIVLITSASAVQPMQPHFAYACAKAATDCLVRYAALEYGPRGIRVNSLQPGPIKSDMSKHLFAIPGVEPVFAREVPLGRVGLPEDYADVVLWLSGPAFVTGVNLPVSGGNHLTRIPRPDEIPGGEDSYDVNKAPAAA
jgi:NAD(P)-dependent dehydrogenase (short-subunit alcohol dehydrogenase family)